jgi:hypothetical protein
LCLRKDNQKKMSKVRSEEGSKGMGWLENNGVAYIASLSSKTRRLAVEFTHSVTLNQPYACRSNCSDF